jgi:predicted phage terminase large subunit-like protein
LNTVLLNQYIPHKPTPKQALALLLDNEEVLYGGAAGGGKSDWLLMCALQYVDVPGYSAIIFRRSFRDLALPGALMDRSKQWLMPTDATWKGQENCWEFPSGAKLAFGYLDTDVDKYRYQSAEFQSIGFDEVTQFEEDKYRYLFSRLRRLKNSHVPLRMRCASNPGGIGHDWVKQRFMVEGYEHNRIFISAKLTDNEYIDQTSYIKSLNNLDPITRRQYLEGDWTAKHGGSIFQREWFQVVDAYPHDVKLIRFWDKAATKPKSTNKDPDYTVGLLLGEVNGVYYIIDIRRMRGNPAEVEALIKQTSDLQLDKDAKTVMEQEPGSSGVDTIDRYNREVLKGKTFYGLKTTGPKAERAAPVASAAEAGNIKLVRGTWNNAFLDELEGFPIGEHDDQVDALSGAFSQVHKHDIHGWSFG